MKNFFEVEALKLMKTMNEVDFLNVVKVELDKALNNLTDKEKNKFESFFEKNTNQSAKKYFVENFYKASVGRKVSVIGRKFFAEGKITTVDEQNRRFEMVIKDASDKKIVGLDLSVSVDIFNGEIETCVFEY